MSGERHRGREVTIMDTRTRPLSTSAVYNISEGVSVKGEEEYFGIFFEPEEKVVEREIKRSLTPTPEEFVAQEQEDKGEVLSRYKIRQVLLDKLGRKYNGFYACPGCLERKELELYRVNENGETPKESDYILLCGSCGEKRKEQRAEKRKEEKKANRKWKRKYVKGDGSSKTNFYNRIRKQVFERDGHKCVWCETLGKSKYEGGSGLTPGLGLAPLTPESKGGERCFDNYVTCCASHRPAKSDKLPLNYIFEEISFKYYLNEQLDDEPVVKNSGARASVNMHLVAEIQQYLHRIAAGAEIDRSKAERLCIKLSESDDDRRRERQQLPW